MFPLVAAVALTQAAIPAAQRARLDAAFASVAALSQSAARAEATDTPLARQVKERLRIVTEFTLKCRPFLTERNLNAVVYCNVMHLAQDIAMAQGDAFESVGMPWAVFRGYWLNLELIDAVFAIYHRHHSPDWEDGSPPANRPQLRAQLECMRGNVYRTSLHSAHRFAAHFFPWLPSPPTDRMFPL